MLVTVFSVIMTAEIPESFLDGTFDRLGADVIETVAQPLENYVALVRTVRKLTA